MTSGTENKDNIGLSGTSAYVAPEYILDGMRLFYVYCSILFHFPSSSLSCLYRLCREPINLPSLYWNGTVLVISIY